MNDAEFWARAFLSSKSWTTDEKSFNESMAHRAAEAADVALAQYRKRFGATSNAPKDTIPSDRNALAQLGMEREKLASLERTLAHDSPAIAESRAKIARLEQLVIANR